MVGCGLSLSRQCELLGVSRSSQYYELLGESAANLSLSIRSMAVGRLARHLRREGVVAGRHRVRQLMRLMGMEALYRRPRPSAANPEANAPLSKLCDWRDQVIIGLTVSVIWHVIKRDY